MAFIVQSFKFIANRWQWIDVSEKYTTFSEANDYAQRLYDYHCYHYTFRVVERKPLVIGVYSNSMDRHCIQYTAKEG